MVLDTWTFWESLRWWSKQSKKYKFRQIWIAFPRVLGVVSKIPRSRGVATLNQDSLETKDLIQIYENAILIENIRENLGWVYLTIRSQAEFPIVSSSSSTLEEPVRVIEEPKEYIVNRSENTFIRLPQLFPFEAIWGSHIVETSLFINNWGI